MQPLRHRIRPVVGILESSCNAMGATTNGLPMMRGFNMYVVGDLTHGCTFLSRLCRAITAAIVNFCDSSARVEQQLRDAPCTWMPPALAQLAMLASRWW